MTRFTNQEVKAINAAWREILELCERTNWSDSGQWRDVERAERKDLPADADMPTTWARAIIVKQWAEGLDNPDRPANKLFWVRPSCLMAFMLGVRHAVERRGDEYNGPLVEECRKLCEAAMTANDAHTRRITGEI